MDERQTDSVPPEPRASARAGFLHAAHSANEQENRCPSISHTAYLGLGSNLGDRLGSLRAAVYALDKHDGIRVDRDHGVAAVYETSPVGGPRDQPLYLNSAVRITTTLDPHFLLFSILHIESDLGRERGERWSARTIDIDILLYDHLTLDEERLTIPHPRLHERRFVLAPLSDIAGDMTHPGLGLSIQELARKLDVNGPSERVVRLPDQLLLVRPTPPAAKR
ncbi:MAG: 2-amino-4-hydroxy-6-hydroxymethyldihydropteridine diphosphokinase [Planctomycetes bacterium]|nr:2-amino-4-hydroxy-6-hydroxymethyldihydropteridine diphosphokinase [Planctomycetota bacterium]